MKTANAGDDWRTVLADIEQFLKRWEFSFSATGFVYARPIGSRLVPCELQDFVDRLLLACNDHFPEAVAFDFWKVAIDRRHWANIDGIFTNFADQIHAQYRVVPAHGRRFAIVIIYRTHAAIAEPVAGVQSRA